MTGPDKQRLAKLCRKYGIVSLSLFGSTVRGEQAPSSDIDLLVDYDPQRHLSLAERDELETELSDVFIANPSACYDRFAICSKPADSSCSWYGRVLSEA